jgi:hypothetical protein
MSHPNISFIIVNNKTMFFCVFIGNYYKSLHISSPLFFSYKSILKDLNNLFNDKHFKSLINCFKIKSIILRDINNDLLNAMKQTIYKYSFNIENFKEIPYAIYNLRKTLTLGGTQFSNIRWHINKFEKNNYHIEIIDLFDDEVDLKKELLHLIGDWRRHAIHIRGFSFSDVRSDKFGVKLIPVIMGLQKKYKTNFIDPDLCLSRVIKINGKVSSFHFGYSIGIGKKTNTFAHSIGITNLSVKHLSEYAQLNFWRYVFNNNFEFVNDGPSWRKTLEIYKCKFRPIEIQKTYWGKINFE